MQMIRSSRLREIIESTGWRIREWRDRRIKTLPTVAVWNRRIQDIAPSQDQHMEVFRGWCNHVLRYPHEWARLNPLIEVFAD